MDHRTLQDPSEDQVHRWTFRDFVTPDPHSIIHVTGHEVTLDALDFTLSSGACVHPSSSSDSVYAPMLIAINHVCKIFSSLGYLPVTVNDLIEIQRQPWFQTLLEQYAERHNLSDIFTSANDTELTGDRIAVLLQALSFAQRTPEMELGVVVLRPDSLPHACHYPPTATQSSIAAWVVVDTRFGDCQFYGVGSSAGQKQQQGPLNEEAGVEDNEMDEDAEFEGDHIEEDDTEEPLNTPLTERRKGKTAARVIAQQVSLPANLTAADILKHHKDRLQYANILKVALIYSNQKISDECKTQSKLKQPSSVVKRINTALSWIEREFGISTGALRAVFDSERKLNGIVVRGKAEKVNDAVIARGNSKIQAAMAWIKAGGPRPRDD